MNQTIGDEVVQSMTLDIDSGAMHALEDELAAINSVRSVKKPLQLFIEDLSNKLFKNVFTISAVVLLSIVCIGLIFWSLFYRVPDVDRVHALKFEIQENERNINALALKQVAMDSLEIDQQIEVEHVRIFDGFTRLAVWIDGVTELAKDMQLDVTYKIENSHNTAIDKTLEVPVTLTFQPVAGSTQSMFINSMKLIRSLLSDHWHLDIVSTKAMGNTNGLTRLQTTIQVWVTNKDGFLLDRESKVMVEANPERKRINEEFIQ